MDSSAPATTARIERHEYIERQNRFLSRMPDLETILAQSADKSERAGVELRVWAEERAAKLNQLSGIFWRDVRGFCAVLSHLSPVQRDYVKRVFLERYGRPLEDRIPRFKPGWFKGGCSKTWSAAAAAHCRQAGHLAAGEVSLAAADRMEALLLETRFGSPAEKMISILEKLNRNERCVAVASFTERYQESHCFSPSEENPRFSELEQKCIQALADGNQALADAIKIKQMILNPEKSEIIYKLIARRSDGELAKIAEEFDAQFYQSKDGFNNHFREFIAKFMPLDRVKKRTLLLLDGDRIGAEVLRVKDGLEMLQGDLIIEAFMGQSQETRERLVAAYHEQIGRPLLDELERCRIAEVDQALIRGVVLHGAPREADLIRRALLLPMPDLDAICRVLGGKTFEDVQRIGADYAGSYDDIRKTFSDTLLDISRYCRDDLLPDLRRRFPALARWGRRSGEFLDELERRFPGIRPITARLPRTWLARFIQKAETRGRMRSEDAAVAALANDFCVKFPRNELRKALLLLKGAPRSCDEAIERSREFYQDAISGMLVPRFLRWLGRKGFNPAAATIEADYLALERVYQRSTGRGEEESLSARRLYTLLRIAQVHFRQFKEQKVMSGEILANWGSAGVLIGAALGCTEAALPFGITIAVVGASVLGARIALKTLTRGSGYNPREFTYDFYFSAIDAAFSTAGSTLARLVSRTPLGRRTVRVMAKIGMKQMVSFSKKANLNMKADDMDRQELNPEALRDVLTEAALAALRG